MVKVNPVRINFVDRAKQLGRIKFASVPLKDGSSAKISLGDNACDCFIVKHNKILGARGAYGKPEHIDNEFACILSKLDNLVEPGIDIWGKLIDPRKL